MEDIILFVILSLIVGFFVWSLVIRPLYRIVQDARKFRALNPHLNSIEKWKQEQQRASEETNALRQALENYRKETEAIIEKLKQEQQKAIEDTNTLRLGIEKYRKETETIIKEKTIAFPWLTHAFADYHCILFDRLVDYLISKRNPAPTSAEVVKAAKAELRKTKAESKAFEYRVRYYEALFPWLEDFIDPALPDDIVAAFSDFDVDNPDRKWLTQAEWESLGEIERSEIAFKRYLASRKTNWQIGRDYEQYIGYLHEINGYEVEYSGMELKLKDLGRDLIAQRGIETMIVQCKNWARDKIIHEKHLLQLYGTFILFCLAHPQQKVSAHFYTSTSLSDTARQVAVRLGIHTHENFPMGDYPRIKCNVNPSTGERIFHLPFDQQYDRTRVNKYSGECYAYTVREAFEKGFRRAMRYHGPMH